MAGIVAHYQHGKLVYQKLGDDIKSVVQKHLKMFDIGLQGPDILYSYKPYKNNHIYEKCNMTKAIQFYRLLWDKGLISFIIGNLCINTERYELFPYKKIEFCIIAKFY